MIKIGGPVYRIGVGGGAASSIEVISYKRSVFKQLIISMNDPVKMKY